jgi:hypothetical protein
VKPLTKLMPGILAPCLILLAPTVARAVWLANGVPVCGANGVQEGVKVVSDGAGGAIVVWVDHRGADADIYAQRVDSLGTEQWTAGGLAICNAAGDQTSPMITSDTVGGAIIAWSDWRGPRGDIYGQRVSRSGDIQWPAGGIPLGTGNADQYFDPPYPSDNASIASDGAGGAVVAWVEDESSAQDRAIYAQHVFYTGVLSWPARGALVCSTPEDQAAPAILSDGQGGAFVAWQDLRNQAATGWIDVYAQRLWPSGQPAWAVNGIRVCDTDGDQHYPNLVGDGAGGAIVSWNDTRATLALYAQRLSGAGAQQWAPEAVRLVSSGNAWRAPVISDGAGGAIVAWFALNNVRIQRVSGAGSPLWGANGVTVTALANSRRWPTLAGYGDGGALVSWQDNRSGDYDIYAQAVDGAGSPRWTANGVLLSGASADQLYPVIAVDGKGGGIIAWEDNRNSGTNAADVYGERIRLDGTLGENAPLPPPPPPPAFLANITSVADEPGDQGGWVRIALAAASADTNGTAPGVTGYNLWRRLVGSAAPSSWSPSDDAISPPAARARVARSEFESVRLGPAEAQAAGFPPGTWESLGFHAATQSRSYLLAAPTHNDSTGAGIPWEVFLVTTHTPTPTFYVVSEPDSGYSVDNFAPAAPQQFAGTYSDGTAALTWARSPEPDFAMYRLHRGKSLDFTPGPGNLVVAQTETGYTDVAGEPFYYKLAAVDRHENSSAYAMILPVGAVGVSESAAGRGLWLGRATPNPMRQVTAIRFALPKDAPMDLTVFDQAGRRVRELMRGTLPAGDHATAWDGRDGAGRRVPSGLYFYRLRTALRTLTGRIVLID